MDPISILLGIGKSVADSLFPSAADKLQNQQAVLAFQTEILKAQSQLNLAAADNVKTEAASSHWLASNWRPITMLTFVVLIVLHFFGLNAPNMTEAQYIELFDLIKIGLGGYVVGRSAEKITDSIVKNK